MVNQFAAIAAVVEQGIEVNEAHIAVDAMFVIGLLELPEKFDQFCTGGSYFGHGIASLLPT